MRAGVGNSMSHLAVARGTADIGWTSRANLWDYAALKLVVTEAGAGHRPQRRRPRARWHGDSSNRSAPRHGARGGRVPGRPRPREHRHHSRRLGAPARSHRRRPRIPPRRSPPRHGWRPGRGADGADRPPSWRRGNSPSRHVPHPKPFRTWSPGAPSVISPLCLGPPVPRRGRSSAPPGATTPTRARAGRRRSIPIRLLSRARQPRFVVRLMTS